MTTKVFGDFRKATKEPAICAVGTNVNVASPGAELDGVTMATSPNKRVLLRAQSTASQGGLHDWHGPTTPMTRCKDADTTEKVRHGVAVPVTGGTAPGLWIGQPIAALGTTAQSWALSTGDAAAAQAAADAAQAAADAREAAWGDPVADLTALAAVAAEDRANGQVRLVEGTHELYVFVAAMDPGGGQGTLVIAPDAAPGAWLRITNVEDLIVADLATAALHRKASVAVAGAELNAAATTQSVGVATIPAGSILRYSALDLQVAFSGGAVDGVTAQLGKAGALDAYISAESVFTGASPGRVASSLTAVEITEETEVLLTFTTTNGDAADLDAGLLETHLRWEPVPISAPPE